MRWVDERGDLRRLGLFRVLVGILVLRHILPYLERARHGHFADTFFVPYVDGLPVPGHAAYVAMLVAVAAGGVLVTAGLFTRAALAIVFVLGSWQFLLNQLFYSNNRVFLLLCVLVLLLSPAHRVFSLDAWLASRFAKGGAAAGFPAGPLWTHYVLRGQASLLYLASGFSKLLDPDWIGGDVLWGRLRIVLGSRSPVVETLASVKPLLGVSAVATELFLGVALWFPRARRFAFWVGFVFHFVIELAFSVHVFSYLMLGTYLLAASGTQRNRVLRFRAESRWQSALAGFLAQLDWLGKLDVEASERLEAVTPDGRVHQGWRAFAAAGDAVPMAFPIAYPLTWLPDRRPAVPAAAPAAGPARAEAAMAPGQLAAVGLAAAAVLAVDVFRPLGAQGKGLWAALVLVALTVACSRREAPAAEVTRDKTAAPAG